MQPRRLSQALVLLLAVCLPVFHLYATARSAGDRDALLTNPLWRFLSAVFYRLGDPEQVARFLRGIPGWTVSIGPLTLTDPLAAIGLRGWSPQLALSLVIPLGLTLLLGRYFCGWICPAGFLFEAISGLRKLLIRLGVRLPHWKLGSHWRHVLLALGAAYGFLTGILVFAWFYPPAILGRELYQALTFSQVGLGTLFLSVLALAELVAMPRVWCHSLCPGGALYSLIGKLRLLRIKRDASRCIECSRCVQVCAFDQSPLTDRIGSDCTTCGACLQACPVQALAISLPRVPDSRVAKQEPRP